MTTIFYKLLVASCVAFSCFSSFAAGSLVQMQANSNGQSAAVSGNPLFADLKSKLKISGAVQEKAWTTFTKGTERTIDAAVFQDITRAKTAPELMNGLEKMQGQAAERFAEQKKVILGLYDSLDTEQRKTFDTFVFSTMSKMMSPGAAR